eukprot:jgi/Ulvmu1/9265/UM050_0014.1
MPDDAENVVAAHVLLRNTYTLAARGMELQQRDRIATMLNNHRIAMEQRQRPPLVAPGPDEPHAATWQHHGAEPVIVDATLSGLREAAARVGQAAGSAVQAFARTLELQSESATTCAVLQDRTNMLLNVGHSSILAAVGTGVCVETVRECDEGDQAPQEDNSSKMSHSHMGSMLGVLKHHVTSLWPCIRRSNLDARVMRRIIGLESFVDFEYSDPAARGMLIHALQDLRTSLLHRFQYLCHCTSVLGSASWDKWVGQERDAAWKCIVMGARGLHKWAALLYSELEGLVQQRTPGTALLMLKARGDGLQKINEQACLLLLGNLMMAMLKSLHAAHEGLNGLQRGASGTDTGIAQEVSNVFSSAVSTLAYALLGHSSEHTFWLHMLQASTGKSGSGGPQSEHCS